MTHDQAAVFLILGATVGMFVWGRWRFDMVAVAALLACVVAGLVPATDAFSGFAHPAVVTVACVLVLSRALQGAGVVDAVTRMIIPPSLGPGAGLVVLIGCATLLSAFVNNVAALALLMPVAIRIATGHGIPAGRFLMPMAFGSILGGMTTLIGTPTNLIVSGFRAGLGPQGFGMFDFTPVGLAVAAVGVLFLALLGWRLVPAREGAGANSFEIGTYLTEVVVTADGRADGKSLREIGGDLGKADAQVVGLVRNNLRIATPDSGRILRANDILIIQAEPETLTKTLPALGLKLADDVPVPDAGGAAKPPEDRPAKSPAGTGLATTPKATDKKPADAGDISLVEVVVLPNAALINRSAADIELRSRFGINLLAISRQGQRTIRRLRSARMRPGDVLLLQGTPGAVVNFTNAFGCVPLAERRLDISDARRAITASTIMILAVAGAAFGLLPAAVSFAAAVLACLALRVLPLRNLYEAVDWPVIVLLGALIPVAGAMAATGAADLLARLLLDLVAFGNPVVALVLIIVVTMTCSDFMNNAATAAVMCPVAISVATQLDASPDPFLMAVAVGASCAFLTPIGHQNNTLILGPGGFHFGDYWRLGLPMELLVLVIATPMLLFVWPL
jgi:di/tricarboxylate transporter